MLGSVVPNIKRYGAGLAAGIVDYSLRATAGFVKYGRGYD